MLAIVRSIISSVVEGLIKRISGSGRPGESFANREYFQHYGFTSRPLSGSEGIFTVQGNNIICIASDDRRYRLAIEEGEVALYTDEGDYVHLKRGNIAEIQTGSAIVNATVKCQVNSPEINLSGDRAGLNRLIDERLLAIYNGHTHPGGGVPNQLLTTSNTCTDIVRGA